MNLSFCYFDEELDHSFGGVDQYYDDLYCLDQYALEGPLTPVLEQTNTPVAQSPVTQLAAVTDAKSEYRKQAVQRWLLKRKRMLHGNKLRFKRPYVARREIALTRPRCAGGKFVKAATNFLPISQF